MNSTLIRTVSQTWCLYAVCIFVLAPGALGRNNPAIYPLTPGECSVGFRSWWFTDIGRTYRPSSMMATHTALRRQRDPSW